MIASQSSEIAQVTVDRFFQTVEPEDIDLNHKEKWILSTLASFCGKNPSCFPSITTLAKRTSLSHDTVQRVIKSLEAKEVIYVTRRIGRSNVYYLNNQMLSTTTRKHRVHSEGDHTQKSCGPHAESVSNIISNNISNIYKAEPVDNFEVPDWLDKDVWRKYVFSRKQKNKPIDKVALETILKKLTQLKDQGNDPTEVLEYSIRGGYTDIFPVRKTTSGKSSINQQVNIEKNIRRDSTQFQPNNQPSQRHYPTPDEIRNTMQVTSKHVSPLLAEFMKAKGVSAQQRV